MGGIRAYKGTIESAEQTLSFLITFIFEVEEMWERRNFARGMSMRNPETLLSLQMYKEKRERIVIDTPASKVPSKKIVCCLISLQNPS